MSTTYGTDPDIRCLQGRRPLLILNAILSNENIPHALLFIGADGVGKQAAALAFARACNCRAYAHTVNPSPSGDGLTFSVTCECRSCRKFRSGNHPDLHGIEPDGEIIKISKIRDLCDRLSLKPYEARMRMVIISRADAMNPEASNALLKVLEEPPDRTVFILTAVQRSDLLPTIASRCQTIRFTPVSNELISRMLAEEDREMTDDEILAMTALSNGSLSKIRSGTPGMTGKDWLTWRKGLLKAFSTLMASSPSPPKGLVLAFAEKMVKKKRLLADSLDILQLWTRDLIVYRYNPESVINRDLIQTIHHISSQTAIDPLLEKVAAIHSARQAIRANANVRLVLENLMLQLTAK